jgi:UDP-N-acetylglucosamine 1-carboxyvinyltransferase
MRNVKVKTKTHGSARGVSCTGTRKSQRTPVSNRQPQLRNPARRTNNTIDRPHVYENGELAYILVPVDEYEELVKESMVAHAIAKLDDPKSEYVDAYDLGLELAVERIVEARKAKGLTQKQLGEKLGLPQSQISRIERNPDRTTVRTLKRIARALGVDVSALIAGI